MPRLRLDLDAETFDRLIGQALSERRPPEWQAEIALRRALGLPFPYAECPAVRADSTARDTQAEAAPERVEGQLDDRPA